MTGNPQTQSFIKFDKSGNITIESAGQINITSAAKVTIDVNGTIDITSSDKMNINVTGDVDLTASGNVNIDSPKVNLGVGGLQIARLGDAVVVDGVPGTITSAGINTSI